MNDRRLPPPSVGAETVWLALTPAVIYQKCQQFSVSPEHCMENTDGEEPAENKKKGVKNTLQVYAALHL